MFGRTRTWPSPLFKYPMRLFRSLHSTSPVNKRGSNPNKKVSKAHNPKSGRGLFCKILFWGADWGMRFIILIFLKIRHCLLNDKTQCFVKFLGICPITFKVIWRYVNFNLSFWRGMRFYQSDWTKIQEK